jgi:luciferase family oxidoreductase group 1
MDIPISVLDLAPIRRDETARDSLEASVVFAQRAEALGYHRVWYAEHHNMPTIASSATSVLIAHIAAHTSTIRVGAGGVMLPNHSPLVIAEQFGTLATLHPGRIDLGLGRAPGSDQPTARALRRNPIAVERFPEDVLELQGYLSGNSLVAGVDAVPGKGTNVPLYILGSSTFGARLAALLGLPYAFASHFAPEDLLDAVHEYRQEFRPSAQLQTPYVIAGLNVLAADTGEEARTRFDDVKRTRVRSMLARGRPLSDEETDALLASPAGQHVASMLTYSAVGDPTEVAEVARSFRAMAGADELMIVHQTPDADTRLRSLDLFAQAMATEVSR